MAAGEKPLPAAPPQPSPLDLTSPAEGYPPKLRGPAQPIPAQPPPSPAVAAPQMRALAATARQDPTVLSRLGNRHALISSGEVRPSGAAREAGRADPPLVRLLFYSHARNVAVEVLMRSAQVIDVRDRPGYQPPEGQEEIAEAVELARNDPRLLDKVQGLTGEAIYTPRYRNRTLYVTFSRGDEAGPRYWADVDLINRTVRAAGAAEPAPPPKR
jgi:hypothetical protein